MPSHTLTLSEREIALVLAALTHCAPCGGASEAFFLRLRISEATGIDLDGDLFAVMGEVVLDHVRTCFDVTPISDQ